MGMVELVYYGADLAKEMGDPLACFCVGPMPHWVTSHGLLTLLSAGEAVQIRPATFAEFLDAEWRIAQARIAQEAMQQIEEAVSRMAEA
jgi:hypothetical protein